MGLDLPQGSWTISQVNWRVLTAESGEEAIRQWASEVWDHYEDVCSYLKWHKVNDQNVWTLNEDDKRWFLYNLLTAGTLHIMVQGAAPDNTWKPWVWSSEKRAYEIIESKLLPQNNSRAKTPCGNLRVRELLLEDTEIKPF